MSLSSDKQIQQLVEAVGLEKTETKDLLMDENGQLKKLVLLCPFCNEDEENPQDRTWGERTLQFDWENHWFFCAECNTDEASPYFTLLSVIARMREHHEHMEGFARLLPALVPPGYDPDKPDPKDDPKE